MTVSRPLLRSTLLATALALAACNSGAPSGPGASAPAATAPAPAPSEAGSPSASPAAASASPASATGPASPVADANRPVPPVGMPEGPAPVEGTDYTTLDTPEQPSGDKVTVVEVFGYGCPHCNTLAPFLSAWEKKLPVDVDFSYLPAAFGPGPAHCWDEFARGFYAAQAMGLPVSRTHDAVFKAVWEQNRFTGDCAVIPKIYADFGLDPKLFASTMQSFAIGAKIGNAHDQEMRWGVDGTPTIIVDGKYKVNAGLPASMLHTVDWLVAKQRPAHAKH